MNALRPAIVILLVLFSANAQAKLNVFACEPEWASLMKELTGKYAKVFSATTAFQDPHRIEARPSLIAKMRRADMVVCSGSDLEVGWLPLLLRSSANKKVQTSQPGYIEASQISRDQEFCNLGNASSRIMDLVDSVIEDRPPPFVSLQPAYPTGSVPFRDVFRKYLRKSVYTAKHLLGIKQPLKKTVLEMFRSLAT